VCPLPPEHVCNIASRIDVHLPGHSAFRACDIWMDASSCAPACTPFAAHLDQDHNPPSAFPTLSASEDRRPVSHSVLQSSGCSDWPERALARQSFLATGFPTMRQPRASRFLVVREQRARWWCPRSSGGFFSDSPHPCSLHARLELGVVTAAWPVQSVSCPPFTLARPGAPLRSPEAERVGPL